jgi:hypothetical protein
MNKSEYFSANFQLAKVNPGSILAVICGTLGGLLLPWGVGAINALVISGIVCFAWELYKRKRPVSVRLASLKQAGLKLVGITSALWRSGS